jgi:hypothetical protein
MRTNGNVVCEEPNGDRNVNRVVTKTRLKS